MPISVTTINRILAGIRNKFLVPLSSETKVKVLEKENSPTHKFCSSSSKKKLKIVEKIKK